MPAPWAIARDYCVGCYLGCRKHGSLEQRAEPLERVGTSSGAWTSTHLLSQQPTLQSRRPTWLSAKRCCYCWLRQHWRPLLAPPPPPAAAAAAVAPTALPHWSVCHALAASFYKVSLQELGRLYCCSPGFMLACTMLQIIRVPAHLPSSFSCLQQPACVLAPTACRRATG